ncbi:MAG: DUF1638 domain-containing protein [Halanaerobiales bacterium]|nr:DUF1638 domain-containing protein [Halanaerobiales bacterium]
MRYNVVACNTLRDEINKVLKNINLYPEIIWIDSGLHNFPEKLNKIIQKEINNIDNNKDILLLFGYCGKSILNVKSESSRIVFPKVDDCISLFLGSNEKKQQLEKIAPSYYFTKGYLENENNIWQEYQYCIKKYGKEKSTSLMKRMLHNYRYIRLIDTKAYDLNNVINKTKMIANEFDLRHQVVKGNLKILYQAFLKEWKENFVIKDKNEEINLADIGLDLNSRHLCSNNLL